MEDLLGLGKAIDLVRDMMTPVGQSASQAWQALVGDRVAYWRVRNAMKYQPLLIAEGKRLGLKLNPARIPDKFAFAWFEEATKQDEEELQTLFARLLARAADEGGESRPDRRLIDILARFTPEDARLFQQIYSDKPFPDAGMYSDHKGIGHERERNWPEDWMVSLLEKVHPGFEATSLENLLLQGCLTRTLPIQFAGNPVKTKLPDQINWRQELTERLKQRAHINATELGCALYAAVKA